MENASTELEVSVFPCKRGTGEWRVECIGRDDGDGSCEVAIFSGPGAERRSRLFACVEYGFIDGHKVG